MRILRVAQKLYPAVKGGATYHVHAMSRDQAAMGHDVTVLTVRHDASLPAVEIRDGYTIVRYDPVVSPLGNDISPGIAQYLRAADTFDVMHAHSHLYFATNLAALKRRLGETPLAITNHGLYSQSAPEWLFESYLQTLGRWTFNQADVIFCYTETDKKRLREYGVTSPVEIVPSGIDTERFTPEGPESELVSDGDPVLLFVGRLVEGKQPSVALEAMTGVVKEYPNATLYVCGDGPLRQRMEQQAEERGVREHVTFLNHVPFEEMPAVYRSADVLVLPSRAEGVPRVVMEALSAGVPVVCSALEPIRSAFGDVITYVERQTGSAFSDGIQTALARDDVNPESIFEWETTVAATTRELLNRVSKNRSSSSM